MKVDDKGDDEDLRGFKNDLESSQCVWMLLIYISWENTLITRNSEKQSHFIKFYKVDHTRGLWFFVKLVKQLKGGWNVLFFFYVLSIWGVVSRVPGMQSISTQASMLQNVTWDLGFFGSLMLLWGFMWSKVIEKRRKASGLKKERSKKSNPLKTSRLSLLVIARI